MKIIPAGLAAHYASGCTTTAVALRITRTDGQVVTFTSADVDAIFDGVLYSPDNALAVSSITTTSGLAVDNLEMATVDGDAIFTAADILAGVWQSAAFLLFRYNWERTADGVEPLLAGVVGNVRRERGATVTELRGLQQYLQQPVGSATSKTCRARFCDHPSQAGRNRCGLAVADWTDSLTVTAAAGRRGFTATGAARGADWYAEGIVTWSTGANAGRRGKVKAYSGAAAFELVEDAPHAIAVGDTLIAVAGCHGRLAEDCRDRFDNVINFQAEPHLPGMDALLTTPDPAA